MRLIDRNSLCEMFVKNQPEWWHHSAVWAVICAAHTIEAEPVKHGRWIPDPEVEPDDPYYASVCSLCGRSARIDSGGDEILTNYCDNCGAKMDLEDKQ